MNGFRKIFPIFLSHNATFFAKMAERKVVPFDEFYYQLKLMYLFQKHPVCMSTKKSKFGKIRKKKRATGEHLYYFFQLPLSLLYTITNSWCGRFDSPCMYLFTFYILFCYFPHPHFVTTIFVRFCSFRVR
jgi:hypothetical protein